MLHCAESGKVTQTKPFRCHKWFHSGTSNLHTHTYTHTHSAVHSFTDTPTAT